MVDKRVFEDKSREAQDIMGSSGSSMDCCRIQDLFLCVVIRCGVGRLSAMVAQKSTKTCQADWM